MGFVFFKSKLFLFSVGLLLVVTLFFIGKQLKKRLEVEREIANLQNQIASLEGRNREVTQMINYFKTREYKERQARSLLNLQKPGEFAVALPPQKDDTAETQSSTPPQESNLMKWWQYWFDRQL